MLQYEMPKVVLVRHKVVASLNRLLQIAIILYFFVFAMWWEKAYQQFDQALSGVRFEVNGLVTSRIQQNVENPDIVLDDADFLLLSNQVSGFFIITRVSAITTQSYGICAEARDLEDARCLEDRHCVPGRIGGQSMLSPTRELPLGWVIDIDADAHGLFTGTCNRDMETCNIYGWCPVQEDLDTLHAGRLKTIEGFNSEADGTTESDLIEPIYDVLNLTVSIKNVIEFPLFNVARQNILPWMTEQYLRTCRYHPLDKRDRFCPNFRISDVLVLAEANTYRILRHGGIIAITIYWKCDLDISLEHCRPRYGFLHMDGQESTQWDNLGPGEGWPTDIAQPLGDSTRIRPDGRGPQRSLSKVNGIQFLIRVTGRAGKFNLFVFTMNFGSNLALLSLASLVCDFILFNCTKHRKSYHAASHNVFLESSASLSYTPCIILDSISRKTSTKGNK